MKYLLFFFAVAFVVSCQNRQAEIDAQKNIIPFDSTQYRSNYSTDVSQSNPAPPTAAYANTANSNRGATTHRTAVHRSYNTTRHYAVAPAKPRGWSSAAKGATIGGVGGAILGGVLTHRVGGAVIGGIIGAGGGYAIGRANDRKTGRVAQGREYRRYYTSR